MSSTTTQAAVNRLFALTTIHRDNVSKLSETMYDTIRSGRKDYFGDGVINLVVDEIIDTYNLLKQLALCGRIAPFKSAFEQASAAFSIVYWGLVDERDSCPIWNRNIIDLKAHLGKVDDELRQFSHSATLKFHIPETKFIIENERQPKYKWEKWLRGHAMCLSRYFSHLGQVFNQEEQFEKKGVHQDELENARKFFASQLSSLELTLLYLYSLTPLGEFLWKKGYLIKYGLLDLLDHTTIPLELLPDSSNRGKGGP